MGNNYSDPTEAEFRKEWQVYRQHNGIATWEHKKHPQFKYDQYNVSDEQITEHQKLALLRKNNPFVLKAYSLKNEGFSCQMGSDAKKLFVQHTPLRLSILRDIPYPDIFHLYDVCIHGYKLLADSVGFFDVDQDQVGINQLNQAKVWLNTRFESSKVISSKVTQSKMVSDILQMLRQVADHQSCGKLPNIYWYIGTHENITFSEVKHKFEQYVRAYCDGWIPTTLKCVTEVGSSKIQSWALGNQNSNLNQDNVRQIQQSYQNGAGGGIIANIAPGNAYVNKYFNEPIAVPASSNTTVITPSSSTFIPPSNPFISTSNNFNPPVNTLTSSVNNFNPPQSTFNPPVNTVNRVTIPVNNQINLQPLDVSYSKAPLIPNNVVAPADTQLTGTFDITRSVVRPLKPQTLVNGRNPQPVPTVTNHRSTSSFNLVRTPSQNFSAEGYNQLIQRPVTAVKSQITFASNRVPVPPTQVIQQKSAQINLQTVQKPVQINLQPLRQQYTTQLPQQQAYQFSSQLQTQKPTSFKPPQSVTSVNATSAISQSPLPTYNQPLQVVESISFTQPREDNRLQQQRVISQTIELKDQAKASETETKNISTASNNYQTKVLKGSQTLEWEDYTNKQKSSTKGLSNFARSVPFSYDIGADKKTQTQFDTNKFDSNNFDTSKFDTNKFDTNKFETTKFTPESDGKSSPQFLALLSQIKSGIGQTNSYSDNYSYSPSKYEGAQGGYGAGSSFQDSKFATSNYVTSKYQGGLDPQLHADLQKYKQ